MPVLGLVFKRTGSFHLGLQEPDLPSKKSDYTQDILYGQALSLLEEGEAPSGGQPSNPCQGIHMPMACERCHFGPSRSAQLNEYHQVTMADATKSRKIAQMNLAIKSWNIVKWLSFHGTNFWGSFASRDNWNTQRSKEDWGLLIVDDPTAHFVFESFLQLFSPGPHSAFCLTT